MINCIVFIWRSLKDEKSNQNQKILSYFVFLLLSKIKKHLKLAKSYVLYQNWFAKFDSGDYSHRDEKFSGRPVEVGNCLQLTKLDNAVKKLT